MCTFVRTLQHLVGRYHFCICGRKNLGQFLTKANCTLVVPEQYCMICSQHNHRAVFPLFRPDSWLRKPVMFLSILRFLGHRFTDFCSSFLHSVDSWMLALCRALWCGLLVKMRDMLPVFKTLN